MDSSFSSHPRNKYDVFLSFRGEDTRDNFTSHLYSALSRKSIETFIDDQLIRGDEISESLLEAIEASSISVIIFSEAYASSRWCLDELLNILERKNNFGQVVIPVFYRVDPSHVRKQTGFFGDLFSKLQERFPEKMQRWRNALTEAANLSGFDSHVVRPESKLIEEIANEVLERLDDAFQSENKDLVGIELRINEIESLLGIGSMDVRKLGIWGIGGIGKTTTAGAVFNKISKHFEGSYFTQNVREAEKTGGLANLRQELLSTLLNDGNVKNIPNIGLNFQSKRLTRKKVLIVFDDVNHPRQIEFLIGSLGCFASGSRIIITTRDKRVLSNCRVDQIYEAKELVEADALKLFSRYAFRGDSPDSCYVELTHKAIKYAQGVPLALKVLGRFLSGRRKEEWESAIRRLDIVPHMEIQEVLKISYDGLDEHEQNIFLDIACFLEGEDKDRVISFLDVCGFFAQIGLSVLVEKSLITISHDMIREKAVIRLHDLLRDMGREIVRRECINDPGKRSRLWHHNDIYDVLAKNTGTEAIEGISLDMSKVNDIHLNPRTFTKMPKLRFLKFYSSFASGGNKCKVFHFKGRGFSEMRYLHWHDCPLKTLPLSIPAENLVSLILPHSKFEKLWDDVQNLVNLKEIDLSDSKRLMKLPDLSEARNVERVILGGCSSLIETHSSIQYLNRLTYFNLDFCQGLRSIPSRIHSESLKELELSFCSNLKRFPDISSCNFKLNQLSLLNCWRLESLPSSLCMFKSLEYLTIIDCPNLQSLPDELGNLEALKKLIVEGTAIREVPSSIVGLNNLKSLSFKRCRGHEQMGLLLPMSFSLNGLRSLTELYLIDCGITELPESLGQLSSLCELYLGKNNFERVPEGIIHLSKLRKLDLSYCERLQTLPELPQNVFYLQADHCTSLEANYLLQEVYYGPNSHVFLPGNEIPKWFSFQSVGSSVTLKLTPGSFNNNKLVGIAACAIVVFGDHHDSNCTFDVTVEWKAKSECCHRFVGEIDYVESDHVLLGHYLFGSKDFDDFVKCYDENEASFHIYQGTERVECCLVKKCGVRLLYTQDSMESTEEGDEPHPKRLKYSSSPSRPVLFGKQIGQSLRIDV